MIDLTEENVISLTEAAKLFPRRRRGAKPHLSTLWRWATAGYRGAKLETIRVGATLCTSTEAVQRFITAMTTGKPADSSAPSPKLRQRQIEAAEKRLASAGIGA